MADAEIVELFAAVEDENEAKVKELIDKGIRTNSFKDESHITPLHYCTQVGDVQMFKLLLENKANLREKDCWMDSVVHYACRYGNTHILKLILQENTKLKKINDQEGMTNLLNLIGKEGKVPISEAILNGHIPCVLMLFNEGAAIDIRDNTGKAPIDLLFDLPSDLQNDIFDKLMTVNDKLEEKNKFVLQICKYGVLHNDKKIEKKINDILENFSHSEKEKWLEIFLQHHCVVEVKKLLEEPNYYTWKVLQSVLKNAVECSNEEIVRLVLNEHTGINADDNCIILSVTNQSIEILKYLLKFSAKVEAWEKYEMRSIVNAALETGNLDVVKVLFDKCGNISDCVDINSEVWVKLIEHKYEKLIKYLLNAGVKLDDGERIYYGIKRPLAAAIQSQNATILKCIIAAGAKPSDPQYSLQLAITTQNIKIVRLALKLPGSNLNDQKITRAAIQTKNSPFLEIMIGLGLGLNYTEFKDCTALTIAVDTNEVDIVKLVYNSGGEFSNSKGEIWKAVEHGSKDILDFLLKRCIIVNLSSNSAWTPLHEAVSQQNLEIVKLLIQNLPQSEINISGRKSNYEKHETPLSLAVLIKNVEMTNFLISAGADINKGGRNLFNAVVSGSEEIVSILLRAGISTCLDTIFGLTILHVAVIRNNVNIVKQLLQLKCINIDAKVDLSHTIKSHFEEKYGYLYSDDISYVNIKHETTPIQLAVRQNSEDIVLELLNNDADLTIGNKEGCLPWVEALFNYNNVMLQTMLERYTYRSFQIDINAMYDSTRQTCLSYFDLGNKPVSQVPISKKGPV